MDEIVPTLEGERGCGGSRRDGGVYLCVGLTTHGGTPVWDTLLDPPTPYTGERFLGIQPAGKDLTEGWPEDYVLLLDMVGASFYPSVASYVEEVRRMGVSRYVPENFDYSRLQGKRVLLGLVHWNAMPCWPEGTGELPQAEFIRCKYRETPEGAEHYPHCLYHLWPLSVQLHPKGQVKRTDPHELGTPGVTTVAMPGFEFFPYSSSVIKGSAYEGEWPKVEEWSPGVFMIVEITHLEAKSYVPDGVNAPDSGLPVVITEH